MYKGNGIRAGWAVLFGCVLLAGCAAMGQQKRLDSLESSVSGYGTALRWGDWDTANDYRMPRKSSEKLKPMPKAELKNIKVTDYEVEQRVVTRDEKLAAIRARITFYDTDTGVVHTLTDRQTWWYNEKTEHWFLDGNFPDFVK